MDVPKPGQAITQFFHCKYIFLSDIFFGRNRIFHRGAYRMRCSYFVLILFVVFDQTLSAQQIDLSGEWSARSNEEPEYRGLGGLNRQYFRGVWLGDYTGLPLNDAARQKANGWSAALKSLPSEQSRPHCP